MDILSDITSRLAVLDVTVLQPNQARLPETYRARTASGRKDASPDAARGLSAYLADHPEGYVQLFEPSGAFASDVRGVSTCLIHCCGPVREVAHSLADGVIKQLHFRPERPTPYKLLTDKQTFPLGEGARVALAFSATRKLLTPF